MVVDQDLMQEKLKLQNNGEIKKNIFAVFGCVNIFFTQCGCTTSGG
jgi:hypothetical protein